MNKTKKICVPLNDIDVAKLNIGDEVLLSGIIYSARDAAHKKLVGLISMGKKLPFDVQGSVIYYVGPSPTKPGEIIGSAGPTTSGRMDVYARELMKMGMKGMIGKGNRSEKIIKSGQKYKCVYFGATGGVGALLAKSIKQSRIIAYEELGPEAIREMIVENFPVIVINDIFGNDLYKEGIKKYKKD